MCVRVCAPDQSVVTRKAVKEFRFVSSFVIFCYTYSAPITDGLVSVNECFAALIKHTHTHAHTQTHKRSTHEHARIRIYGTKNPNEKNSHKRDTRDAVLFYAIYSECLRSVDANV